MQTSVGGQHSQQLTAALDRMSKEGAAAWSENTQLMNKLSSFIGPTSEGAQVRLKKDRKLLATMTSIPEYLNTYAKMKGWDAQQTQAVWRDMAEHVSTGKNLTMTAGFNPIDDSFADFAVPDRRTEFLAKYEQSQYVMSGLQHNTPEFAQEMMLSAMLPIAREMIPNTVFLKAFQTDSAVGELSKPYVMKDRHPAYQQGLAEEVSGDRPAPVLTYDPMLVTPTEWRRPIVTDLKWIETMNFDVAADALSDGGREMQVLFDNAGFHALDQLVPIDPGGFPNTGDTVNGFTVYNGNVMMLEQKTNPTIEHLNTANQILRGRGYNPDLLIVSPFELGMMMNTQAVLMAYAYGTREVQETGLVGTLVGNAVAWTPNLWQDDVASSMSMWVCDSDELARIVLGLPISLYTDFSLRKMEYVLYCRLAEFFRNTRACVRIACNNADTGLS